MVVIQDDFECSTLHASARSGFPQPVLRFPPEHSCYRRCILIGHSCTQFHIGEEPLGNFLPRTRPNTPDEQIHHHGKNSRNSSFPEKCGATSRPYKAFLHCEPTRPAHAVSLDLCTILPETRSPGLF